MVLYMHHVIHTLSTTVCCLFPQDKRNTAPATPPNSTRMLARTLPTRSAPTSAALVYMPPPSCEDDVRVCVTAASAPEADSIKHTREVPKISAGG